MKLHELARRTSDRGPYLWIALAILTALCLVLSNRAAWLVRYPDGWTLPISDWIAAFAEWFEATFHGFFRALNWVFSWPMRGAQLLLQWLPWPLSILTVCFMAARARGWRLAVFALLSLLYLVAAGYWHQSMNTLALVLIAVPVSFVAGFSIGATAIRFPKSLPVVEALLDTMQTMPAFAYLIPLLLLFGFGPVVGLIAGAIYATPPMVRNTLLGLQQVPPEVKESGLMSGCNLRQAFWLVDVPTAMPQLLVGLNQTIMSALSVIIIASIIGGFEDIGWEVLVAMRKAQFGQSVLSGAVIALLAMLIDRISRGLSQNYRHNAPRATRRRNKGRMIFVVLFAFAGGALLHLVVPDSDLLPQDSLINAEWINEAVMSLVRNYATPLNAIKNEILYFFMLPLRVGLVRAISPMSWGFALTPSIVVGYVISVLAISGFVWKRLGWRPSVAIVVGATFLFFGLTTFPWPAYIALITALSWRVAGWRIALFTLLGLLFILATGMWLPAMFTIYLCGFAVLLCLLIGGVLGFWAAHDDHVSAILRPVSDTLQTVPQFVFLIPALMFFQIGEFTALIAIMLYAIVPPIRYVEHGLRYVRSDVVEAARQMGCTRIQLLWKVKLPLALPTVMLGVNQTIMAALSMVAITSLVGTRDLGQQIYIALGQADPGHGLVAGLSVALLAMISDRNIRAWVARKQQSLLQ